MQVCWTHRPESKLSHRHRRTDLGPFDRSFLFPKPLNCLPDSLRKKPCKQVARPNCASTFWRLAKVAIFTTNVDTKHNCLLTHKTVIRDTEPPLLPSRCYMQCLFLFSFSNNVQMVDNCLFSVNSSYRSLITFFV